MKALALSLAAASAFCLFILPAAALSPLTFEKAVEGCSDNSYKFVTSSPGEVGEASAERAKMGFCLALSRYK